LPAHIFNLPARSNNNSSQHRESPSIPITLLSIHHHSSIPHNHPSPPCAASSSSAPPRCSLSPLRTRLVVSPASSSHPDLKNITLTLLTEIVALTTRGGVVVPILISSTVYVTVTPTDCSAAGTCTDAALSSPPPSTVTSRNALQVLRSVESLNALSILTSALDTNSPVPPVTFSPAIFTSYGVTVATGSQTETGAPIPTTGPSSPAPPPYSYAGSSTAVTTVTPPVESPPVESPPVESPPASGPPSPPGSTPVGPVTPSSQVVSSGTTYVPVPIPTTVSGSAVTTYSNSPLPPGTFSVPGSASTAPGGGSTAGPVGGSSSTLATYTNSQTTKTGVTAGPEQTTGRNGGGQTTDTTAAPAAATNAAVNNQQPAAIGMVAAIGGALLFV
jgi:hypothetical protein